MAKQNSPGQALARMLDDTMADYRMGPVVGDRTRPLVWGVTPQGSFVDSMTLDGFLARAGEILLESNGVYVFGNSIVYEAEGLEGPRLTTLAVQQRAEPNAPSLLANRFCVAQDSSRGVVQSLAPAKLVGALLADESLWRRLPVIRYHAHRPAFDLDFNLCRPGWNPGSGILVHSGEVDPTIPSPCNQPDTRAVDRLPPLLRGLLGEFSWRSDADLTNALAMLLTGLLVNHFIDDPHPGGLVDANQPGTGKTLYVQVMGRILDGVEPPRIPLASDEELCKQLCSHLRSARTSLFFLDNVRSRIESSVLEQNMLSPQLSFRILGRSATIERPNGILWLITSNQTAGTPDFIRRCLPIRQFFEGDTKSRRFAGNPLAYASEHRHGLLGELAGMVLRWVERGKVRGSHKHRCDRWAATIGGILAANNLGEFFLANAEEAEAQMDQGLVDLTTLAEHAVSKGLSEFQGPAGDTSQARGMAPAQWVPLFVETQVLRDKLADASPRGKSTAVGVFLSGKVGRTVPIETDRGHGTATLRRRQVGAGQKLYFFEVATRGPDEQPTGPVPTGAIGADASSVRTGGAPGEAEVQGAGAAAAGGIVETLPDTDPPIPSSDPEWL